MDKKDFLKRFYPIILIIVVFIVWKYRESQKSTLQQTDISGMTMGTIGYNVKYFSKDGLDYGSQIDSLLKVWNQSLSTYIPNSEISRFNADSSCFFFESRYFLPVLIESKKIFDVSEGAFDPTIGSIVNAWGFGPDKSMVPDSSSVDSLMAFVGFEKISFTEENVCKTIKGVKLDFSAIAKGYAVDVVADYLQSKGIENLLVEIGGEIVCRGNKPGGEPWRTAIEDPTVEVYEQKILAVASLNDRAVATSGNYRNYYVKDGRKYAHTIDPISGYPIFHSLLSASVFAENCMIADAYATAFMVLGMEKSIEILTNDPSLDAFLIYQEEDGSLATYVTDGIAGNIETHDAGN